MEGVVLVALTVISAIFVVSESNIIYAVTFLLGLNVFLGILYYMLGAPMVAIFQLAIFAGAIVVFFLVAVMLTSGGSTEMFDEEVVEK
jgi:NADH-quinone oxidoreductase subunit J